MADLGRIAFRIADYAPPGERPETSLVTFGLTQITAANYAQQCGLNIAGQAAYDLQQAVLGVTRGNLQSNHFAAYAIVDSQAASADPEAQREEKLMVTVEDTTDGTLSTIEVPCVDISALQRIGKDGVNMVDGGVAEALRDAINTHAQDKRTGNDLNCVRMTLVGRNL